MNDGNKRIYEMTVIHEIIHYKKLDLLDMQQMRYMREVMCVIVAGLNL